jgi:hypothetical protein
MEVTVVKQSTMGKFLEAYWKLCDVDADLTSLTMKGSTESVRNGEQAAISDIGRELSINISWQTRGQGLLSATVDFVPVSAISEAFRKSRERCEKEMFAAVVAKDNGEAAANVHGKLYALTEMENRLALTGLIKVRRRH